MFLCSIFNTISMFSPFILWFHLDLLVLSKLAQLRLPCPSPRPNLPFQPAINVESEFNSYILGVKFIVDRLTEQNLEPKLASFGLGDGDILIDLAWEISTTVRPLCLSSSLFSHLFLAPSYLLPPPQHSLH